MTGFWRRSKESIAPGAAGRQVHTFPQLPETGRERRAQHRMRREKESRGLSVQFESSPAISSKSAISSTRWTMRRRSPGSFIRMNALVSASPSVVAKNSAT